jgi:hypothetical protein
MMMTDFIKQFAFGGLISIGIGSPKARDATYRTIDKLPDIPVDKDVYFSPAMRKTAGDEKEDVLGSAAVWAECDFTDKPLWTITPTYAVFSGHGWHCYWFLDKPCLDVTLLEKLNKLLAADVKGDMACWNANRVLRVPGTVNRKDPSNPIKVEIRHELPALRYSMDELLVLENLNKKTRHKVSTGDSRGYRSRSERDWAILTELVAAGASDDLIIKLFETQPCGDKHRESGSAHYLVHSLERIREKAPEVQKQEEEVVQKIVARDDGYYVPYRKALRRVSTFLLDPKILLDGEAFDTEDSLVCDVYHDGYRWDDKTFSRNVFNSAANMAKATPVAAWQWLGTDADVKQLLPYLLELLKEKGLPRVAATKVLGLHNINGRWLFLGNNQVISRDDVWQGFDGPLAWMTSKTEHPTLELDIRKDHNPKVLGELVPQLNEPAAIWPMIGWYTAAVLKPWLELSGYRFPILNVAGTRGSGKTTLIQRVFMPMWGQTNPTSYDSGTTKFVTLALLGASNAVPIAFSEFRVDAVQRFLRFVLLAYDTGHDPRGRADQTTQDYKLEAPFTLDGEDLIDDAAARERIVVARLHPVSVAEGTPAYNAFKEMQFTLGGVPKMAGTLISRILHLEPHWADMLKDAREEVFVAFPSKIPDRVRNNHVVTYFGMKLWQEITESAPVPDPAVLQESILSVFDLKAGRSRTLCDDFTEYVVNQSSTGTARYKYDVEQGVFWFQMAPAYGDWVASRRRQGRGVLEMDAIKTQLSEAPYQVTPQVKSGTWMYGVDLDKAFQNGLDVPSQVQVFKFNGKTI